MNHRLTESGPGGDGGPLRSPDQQEEVIGFPPNLDIGENNRPRIMHGSLLPLIDRAAKSFLDEFLAYFGTPMHPDYPLRKYGTDTTVDDIILTNKIAQFPAYNDDSKKARADVVGAWDVWLADLVGKEIGEDYMPSDEFSEVWGRINRDNIPPEVKGAGKDRTNCVISATVYLLSQIKDASAVFGDSVNLDFLSHYIGLQRYDPLNPLDMAGYLNSPDEGVVAVVTEGATVSEIEQKILAKFLVKYPDLVAYMTYNARSINTRTEGANHAYLLDGCDSVVNYHTEPSKSFDELSDFPQKWAAAGMTGTVVMDLNGNSRSVSPEFNYSQGDDRGVVEGSNHDTQWVRDGFVY